MNEDVLKRSPIRLEEGEYQQLREQVLRRDGWRCQFCGSMTNLEVHTSSSAVTPALMMKTTSSPSATPATHRCIIPVEKPT
jgi:hypothetical protein